MLKINDCQRIVYTHAYLYEASCQSLRYAEKSPSNPFNHCLTSIILSAFTLEAFLNCIGMTELPYWKIVEKKLSPSDKLEIICIRLKFKPNKGIRPFQSFDLLFKARDLLAHGKTEILPIEHISYRDRDKMIKPKTKWEELIDLKHAKDFNEDVKDMVHEIYNHTSGKIDPLQKFTSGKMDPLMRLEITSWKKFSNKKDESS